MSRREIEKRAEAFCKEHKIDEYPVGIIGLCQKHDIQVFEERLPENVSGFIVAGANHMPEDLFEDFSKYNADNLIVVNSSDSAQRRRFTIAHELAHYVLHREEDEPLYAHRDAGQHSSIETEANLFASNILMPEELVKDALRDLGKYIPFSIKVQCISRDFAVSTEAASIRLNQLGIS